MRKFLLAVLMISMVWMTGCAKMPTRGEYVVMDTAPVITPAEDEGLVCFLRERAFTGGGISYYIFEDTKKIGLLRSGSYFIHPSKAGKHSFIAETEAKAVVTLNVEPGKTTYVLGGVSLGAWAGRPTLTEVTESVAKNLLPKLKYTRLSTPEEYSEFKQKEKEKNEM